MIAALCPKTDAGSIRQPQTPTLRLLVRHLQPLAPPDPLDTLVVDQPSRPAQQRGDLAVAVAAIAPGELNQIGRQPFLVLTAPRKLALRRAMLTERPAGPTLRNAEFPANMLDAGTATRGA